MDHQTENDSCLVPVLNHIEMLKDKQRHLRDVCKTSNDELHHTQIEIA